MSRLDELIADLTSSRITRRQFMQRAAASAFQFQCSPRPAAFQATRRKPRTKSSGFPHVARWKCSTITPTGSPRNSATSGHRNRAASRDFGGDLQHEGRRR